MNFLLQNHINLLKIIFSQINRIICYKWNIKVVSYLFVRKEWTMGAKRNFQGAKFKKYSIIHVNVESSGSAGAHPQLHVDPPLVSTSVVALGHTL